jgi:hypothetical protein
MAGTSSSNTSIERTSRFGKLLVQISARSARLITFAPICEAYLSTREFSTKQDIGGEKQIPSHVPFGTPLS